MDNQNKNPEQSGEQKKKRNPLWLVIAALVIIIILLLCRSCGTDTQEPINNVVNEPVIEEPVGNFEVGDKKEQPIVEKEEKEIPTITFAGYGKYVVSQENPNVEMKNPAGNFVDMVFTLSDKESGELIARTGKVKAGDFVYVNVMDFYLEAGTYEVCINISAYDSKSGAQMNGMNQEMEIIVK